MARPSDFSPELATEICRRIAEGASLRKVCQADDMPDKATVLRWLAIRVNTEFRDQYARARELWADGLFDETLEIADDATNDVKIVETGDMAIEVVNHENIQRSRLRVDTRKWAAARLAPKKYGDRIVNEHSGPDGGAIPVQLSATKAQVLDDLGTIFGAAAVTDAPAAEPAASDPVVREGPDSGSEPEPGAPAPGQEVAGAERPVLLADDDMPAEGP